MGGIFEKPVNFQEIGFEINNRSYTHAFKDAAGKFHPLSFDKAFQVEVINVLWSEQKGDAKGLMYVDHPVKKQSALKTLLGGFENKGINGPNVVHIPCRWESDDYPNRSKGVGHYVTDVIVEPQDFTMTEEIGNPKDPKNPDVNAIPEYAKLIITFEPKSWHYTIDTQKFQYLTDEDWDTTSEFLQVSPKGLFWNDDLTPLKSNQSPGILMRSGIWEIKTYYNHPRSNIVNMKQFENTVNSSKMKSFAFLRSFEREELYLSNPVLEFKHSPFGDYFNMTYSLLYREGAKIPERAIPNGWNTFPRGKTQGGQLRFSPIREGKDGAPVYFRPYKLKSWRGILPLG